MSYYADTAHFERNLAQFFALMQRDHYTAVQQTILSKKLLILIHHTHPDGIISLDGRHGDPLVPTFSKPHGHPDLHIKTSTQTLHHILLGEQNITKAIGAKKLVFKGSLRTAMALADLFYASQNSYQFIISQDV
jgi:hypothetical protein